MVLIAGLDWLVIVTQTLNFYMFSHDLFLVDKGFLLVNNDKQFEESVLNLRICSTKG